MDRPSIPLVLGVLDRRARPLPAVGADGHPDRTRRESPVPPPRQAIYPLPANFGEVVLNTMWALDDFTEANGATRLVPGQPPLDRPHARASRRHRPAMMPAGSVIFYVGQDLARRRRQHHRSAPVGRDPRVRRGVAAGPGEPPVGGAAGGRASTCPSDCRSCSGTTSTRRSWAMSTDDIPVATSPSRCGSLRRIARTTDRCRRRRSADAG